LGKEGDMMANIMGWVLNHHNSGRVPSYNEETEPTTMMKEQPKAN
jgi:hypothetical protein